MGALRYMLVVVETDAWLFPRFSGKAGVEQCNFYMVNGGRESDNREVLCHGRHGDGVACTCTAPGVRDH